MPRTIAGWTLAVMTMLNAAAAAAQTTLAAPGRQDMPTAAQPGAELMLLAAGSLRDAMRELTAAYRQRHGEPVTASFGPSGKLREQIEGGARMDVFASASVDHTDALLRKGLLGASTVFAHNDLCIVSQPAVGLDEANLLDVLARPALRVATSTPVADPMGDYTWQFFRNADRERPGLLAQLDARALKLSGASAPAPGAKLPYVMAFEHDQADVYIMYCTNAVTTLAALPALKATRIPNTLNVRSAYGIGARPGSASGERFVQFVLGPEGKAVLLRHGFN